VLDDIHATIHAAVVHAGVRRAVAVEPGTLALKKPRDASVTHPSLTDSLQRLVQFAGVGAALLPLVGFVVRTVRFWGIPGGVDWMPRSLGLNIAAGQDLTHLALSGFHADFVILQWVVVWAVWGVLRGLFTIVPSVDRWLQVLLGYRPVATFVLVAAAALVLAFYAWFLDPIIGAFAMAVITIVGWWLIGKEMTRTARVSWNSLIGAALIVGLAAAIADGSMPSQPQGEQITFAADATAGGNGLLVSGWYGELGRTSDQVFLTPCDDPSGTILVVAPSEIVKIVYASAPPRSRAVGLHTGRPEGTVGLQAGCAYP
jgi:hypothetical protein